MSDDRTFLFEGYRGKPAVKPAKSRPKDAESVGRAKPAPTPPKPPRGAVSAIKIPGKS